MNVNPAGIQNVYFLLPIPSKIQETQFVPTNFLKYSFDSLVSRELRKSIQSPVGVWGGEKLSMGGKFGILFGNVQNWARGGGKTCYRIAYLDHLYTKQLLTFQIFLFLRVKKLKFCLKNLKTRKRPPPTIRYMRVLMQAT